MNDLATATAVTSKDGTRIAYEISGQGPALILVDGALCHRNFGPSGALSAQLSSHFTVYRYDRRGRGESGDTLPYAVEREVEDLAALIEAAGGSAFVYGTSSGAALALEAAISGLPITRLALYEPPYNSEPSALMAYGQYVADVQALLANGKRGDAVVRFMSYVGTPTEAIDGMKHAPFWPMFEAVAPTLAYDGVVLRGGAVPAERAASVNIPTIAITGGATLPFMHVTADALVDAIPNAQRRVLDGQTHDVAAEVVAPVLVEFFLS